MLIYIGMYVLVRSRVSSVSQSGIWSLRLHMKCVIGIHVDHLAGLYRHMHVWYGMMVAIVPEMEGNVVSL